MKTYQFEWEDDDNSLENENQEDDNREFMELLANSPTERGASTTYRLGDKVRALIVHMSDDSNDVMVELGAKGTASISKDELRSNDGSLTYKVGDSIEAFIVSVKGDDIVLSNSLSHKVLKENAVDDAYAAKLPVKGKVQGTNKGGFDVVLLGKKAFCPISQMDMVRIEDPNEYVGKEFDFLIQKVQGRNIVVSRTVLLKRKAQELLSKLEEGTELDGVVKEIRNFGAMMDIGGVVGVLHISEIGYGHVTDIHEMMKVGDHFRVKIIRIEQNAGPQGQTRISLSRKQVQTDPWSDLSTKLSVGDTLSAKVVRLTNFGAFAELFPGVDGLIHLSEMSWVKRVHNPAELLKLGDRVEVRVLEIDVEKRRISLSIKSVDADPWQDVKASFPEGSEHDVVVNALKGFGALVELKEGVLGLVPRSSLFKAFGESYRRKASPPQKLRVKIVKVDQDARKVLLSPAQLEQDDEAQKDYLEFLKMSANEKETNRSPKIDTEGKMGSLGQALADSLKKKRT